MFSRGVFGHKYGEEHESDDGPLQHGVVVQPNRQHAHVWCVTHDLPHNLFFFDPQLSAGVQSAVIYRIVVALREDAHFFIGKFLDGYDTMHNWNGFIFELEDDDISRDHSLPLDKEQNVTSVIRRLHASTVTNNKVIMMIFT